MDNNKMNRRDAIRAMMLAGAGLAASSSLAAPLRAAGIVPQNWKFTEPAQGDQVIHRTWKSLGNESISLLGMGCMRFPRKSGAGRRAPLDQEAVNQMIDYALEHGINYFDTAPAYGDSERATGEALSRHKRKDYLIATKMSNFSNAELGACKTMFANSLKNLRTDYVDYFLLHSIGSVEDFNKRFKDNGLLPWLQELRKKGTIRHLGFSFHGSNAAMKELLAMPYNWEFVQIQLNYVDWKDMPLEDSDEPCDSETLYNMLAEKNIPVVIMEPIRGGALANVSSGLKNKLAERFPTLSPAGVALTYASTFPAVMCTLSGMSNMQQLMENVYTFSHFKPFSAADNDYLMEMARLYNANPHIPCTACRYCMPCPRGVDIPGVFAVYNGSSDELMLPDPKNKKAKDFKAKKNAFLKRYATLNSGTDASFCVMCNACLPKCPQRIRIPDQMRMIHKLVKDLG
jgi:hypothetical protein